MDTTKFDKHSNLKYKTNTVEHWVQAPCGSNYGNGEFGTREYFDEVEHHRYATHPWILESINRFGVRGKKVLEIGFGMGTDHLNLARNGAQMTGVDLTPRNREVTQNRLALYGFQSDLRTADAENLDFEDGTFDLIYSFGVIHHTPDTSKAIAEIHRVLKPGGKCWVTVYHRNSVFFWWSVFAWDWLFHFGWRRESLKQRISRVEYPNNSSELVIRLYGGKEFATEFQKFSSVKISIDHLIPEDISLFGPIFAKLPRSLKEWMSKRWGWYVIAEATK